MQFDYYYGTEAEQFAFYRIPKVLFKDKRFKNVSTDAKVLYGLMLDRMGLSIKNRRLDDNDKVYIIYTIADIMEDLNCGEQKALKILGELDGVKGIGLIERKRQGLGRPNIIYVKNFNLSKEFKNHENHNSRNVKITDQECSNSKLLNHENHGSGIAEITVHEQLKSQCNNTNYNNTEYNDNYISDTDINNTELYPSIYHDKGEIDGLMDYRKIIENNICYDTLILQENKKFIDDIVEVMADVVTFPADTYFINQTAYKSEIVKSVFLKITYEHICNIVLAFSETSTKIKNPRNYLISTIFNAYQTSNVYLQGKFNHDFRKRGSN